ncbi:YbaN family protein [Eubacterium multiforme]|uniref:Uncharacterized membrane protein YbaN (DUF454 family) n=1 Tax=Eubacterium multiforme TaxID=83339 RepID=A0ABT9UPI2_9FIRM|nr:YbaN family protein [Eubacterium multiforme]MDQ0148187.1 uncharacterized membrane protein YbaN (DUF454 family) [Eubacterium multiforme]
MNKIKKCFYIIIGFIALALGAIGVVIPVLPTTPFLLLASFCFVKGSDKFDRWFKGTKLYKKHLDGFVKNREMTLKQKIVILVFADTMMMIPVILIDSTIMRVSILLVIVVKLWYFIFRIKTVKKEELSKDVM